jgi:hypothetical protein
MPLEKMLKLYVGYRKAGRSGGGIRHPDLTYAVFGTQLRQSSYLVYVLL